jgi:hypothetical protein
MKLPVIRVDWANHGIYGSVIYAVSAVLLTVLSVVLVHNGVVYVPFWLVGTTSLLVVVGLALFKDLYYDRHLNKGTYEPTDIWFTVGGGAVNHIMFNLGHYFVTIIGVVN